MEDKNIAVLLKLLSLSKTTRSSYEACIIRDILVNSNHPLISTYHLRKEAIAKIAQTASLETYDPHRIIFQQHEVCQKLYVVLSGNVGIYFPLNYNQSFEDAREGVQDDIFNYSVEDYKRQLRLIHSVEKANWFGDLGLMNHGSNCSIAISETPVHLMVIEHAEYHSYILEKELNNLYYKLKVFQYNMFSDCSANNKRILYNLSKKVNFRQNQAVVEEDQPVQDIFIIKKGDFVISKLIYDENTMAEYLSDPMKVAAQYSGQQFMRAKPKNHKRYARNTCVKVIQKYEIIGDMDVAARRNSSFTCKCEKTEGGTTLSIPSEVFHYIYSVDFHFQQALRLGLRAKAQDFQERVHNISIQIQKFGDFFFFKGRQELLQDQEQSMGNLGEQFALIEQNKKDIKRSSLATEAVSQLAESIRNKEKEAKSCYDFTYFPLNQNKIQANLDKILALSSHDYDANPAVYFNSDKKTAMQTNMLSQVISKKPSTKTITSPLNFTPPTYEGFLHKEQITDDQQKLNEKVEEDDNGEDKINQLDLQYCDSNPNQQEIEWLTEIYPFNISAKVKDEQSPMSSTSISQKNPRGYSNLKEKSAFYIPQEIPLIPFKKHIELSILENEGDDTNERMQLRLLDEDLNIGLVADTMRQSGIKNQEKQEKVDEEKTEKEQYRKISTCLSQNNDSQGSPSSVTSPVFEISSQQQQQHYSSFANPISNSSNDKIELTQQQIDPQTPKMTQSQKLCMTPSKRKSDNSSNGALSFIQKRHSTQSGREMIRDKLLLKAIESTESMKQDVMKEKDIIGVADFKSTGKYELKSLMEIQNLQKRMTEKQDPTKYDHRIKAQQMRVLDLNIKLREQRGKEGLEQERKNKEMQFNDISDDEKRNMIKSHLERLGLKQIHITPKSTFSNRSIVAAEDFSMQVEAQNNQDNQINSNLNSQGNQNQLVNIQNQNDNNTNNDNITSQNGSNDYQCQIQQSKSTQDLSPLEPSRQKIEVPRRLPSGLTPRTVSRFNKSLKQTRSSPFLAEATIYNCNKSTFFKDSRTSSFINYNEVGTLEDMHYRRSSESTSINNINSKWSFEGGTGNTVNNNNQGNLDNNMISTDLNPSSNNLLPSNNVYPYQETPIVHNRQTSQTSPTKQKKIHFRSSVDEYLQMKAHALSTNYDKKKLKSQDLPFLDSYANQLQINLKRLFYVKLQEKYGHEDSLENMQDRIADQMLDQNFKQYLKKNKDILPQKKNLNYLYNWRNKEEQPNQGATQSGQQQLQQQQQLGQTPKKDYLKDSIPSQGFSFKKQKLPQLYQNHKAQNDAAMSFHIRSPSNSNQFNLENDKQTSKTSSNQYYLNSTYQKHTNNHHLNSYYSSQTEDNNQKSQIIQESSNNVSSQEGRESFIKKRIKQFTSNMQQISQKTNQTTLQFKSLTKRQIFQRNQNSEDVHEQTSTKVNNTNIEFQTYKTTIYSNEQKYLQELTDKTKNNLIEQNNIFETYQRAEKSLEQDKRLVQSSSLGNLDQQQVHSQGLISLKNDKNEENNKITFNQMKTLSRKNYLETKNSSKNSKEIGNQSLSVEEEMKELTHSIILKYGLQARFKHKQRERQYQQNK